MAQDQMRPGNEDDFLLGHDEDEDTQANKYLIFQTGDEAYGIPISHVTEIVELQKITEVPEMPDFIKGVMNLRGLVIPLIDVRLRFHLPARDYDDRTCIVIISVREKQVGFIVDRVSEILEIEQVNISPPPQFKKDGVKNRYIQGLGKVGEDVKILLDVEEILQEDEMAALGAASVNASQG